MGSYVKELQSETLTSYSTDWHRGDSRFRFGVAGDIRWGSHGRFERKRPGKPLDNESLVVSLDKRAATALLKQLADYVNDLEHGRTT